MNDLTKAMQVFVAVVEGGSFVSAAEKLSTSTAAVSRQISAAEADLGARLLNRTTRRLSLTEAGQVFYEHAQTILGDIAELQALVGQHTLQPTGLLRISAPLSFGIHELAKVLPGFRQRYPGLRLDVDLTDRLVDLVHDSTDVAVRIARTLGPNLIARKISPVPMIVCASPAYLARRGVPLVPEDLALHDTLGYSYLLTGDNWVFHHRDGQESVVRIQPAVHATNGDLLRALAVGGEGITVQPDFIVRDDLAAGRLVPLLNDWHMGEFYLYAVYLSRKHLSAKVRAFIDYLAEIVRDQAP